MMAIRKGSSMLLTPSNTDRQSGGFSYGTLNESLTAVRSHDTGWLEGKMPVISRFYGILIKMYFREHGRPHFHAI